MGVRERKKERVSEKERNPFRQNVFLHLRGNEAEQIDGRRSGTGSHFDASHGENRTEPTKRSKSTNADKLITFVKSEFIKAK